jgi:dUTP pyrophosphatase
MPSSENASPNIKIRRLANACNENDWKTELPSQRIELVAAIHDPLILRPRQRLTIPTGLALELPPDWEAQIHPLATMAIEHGITVLNSPGTIDPDYRGEVMVILVNLGERDVTIDRGTPIAVMSFSPFTRAILVPSENLQQTARSSQGLGSTGR